MDDSSVKPIQTYYNDYLFRSRLEARWAVFFDALGVPYEYEKEGYDLSPFGLYLPDFWMPRRKAWVEIKGDFDSIDADAHAKARALAIATGSNVFILAGLPRIIDVIYKNEEYEENEDLLCSGYEYISCKSKDPAASLAMWRSSSSSWGPELVDFMVKNDYRWSHQACGNAWGIDGEVGFSRLVFEDTTTTAIVSAVRAMKSARFEHGESPRWSRRRPARG